MEYNTTRNYLVMREYGRHIQKMVEYLLTIEDREKRQQQTKIVIELMGFLNPHLKNVEDFRHMLWDHLFFVSGFRLDVDSPYPIPQKETYKGKPKPMPYPKRYPRYSHLGKNLELVIDKAIQEEDTEKRAGFSNAIAYYMKLAYSNWHKELVHDDAIRSELNNLTGGRLEFVNTPYIKHRVQAQYDDYRNNGRKQNFKGRSNSSNTNNSNSRTNSSRNNGGNSGNRNNNNNNNNHNNRNNNNRNQSGYKKRF